MLLKQIDSIVIWTPVCQSEYLIMNNHRGLTSFENLFASAIYIKPHFASLIAHIQNPAAHRNLVT